MSNMSYCRFENTASDFADCLEAMQHIIHEQNDPLSDRELKAARRLAARAVEFIELIANAAQDLGSRKYTTEDLMDDALLLDETIVKINNKAKENDPNQDDPNQDD